MYKIDSISSVRLSIFLVDVDVLCLLAVHQVLLNGVSDISVTVLAGIKERDAYVISCALLSSVLSLYEAYLS